MMQRLRLGLTIAAVLTMGLAAHAETLKAPAVQDARQGGGWFNTDLRVSGCKYGSFRCYFQFDVRAIPENATITAVKAHFYVKNVSGDAKHDVGLRQVTSSWTEAGGFQTPANVWSPFAAKSQWKPGEMSDWGWKSIEFGTDGIRLVQDWVDGGALNYGLLLTREATATPAIFQVADHAVNSPNGAYLEITYRPAP